jgi:hypothetical protein
MSSCLLCPLWVSLVLKSYWRWAKRVNGGRHCIRLQPMALVNRDLMEAVIMPVSNLLMETDVLGCSPPSIILKKIKKSSEPN